MPSRLARCRSRRREARRYRTRLLRCRLPRRRAGQAEFWCTASWKNALETAMLAEIRHEPSGRQNAHHVCRQGLGANRKWGQTRISQKFESDPIFGELDQQAVALIDARRVAL